MARLRGEPLLRALEDRLPDARDHADAVASYSFAVAVELGLDRDTCLLLREAARLHEVGKLYVPAELLQSSAAGRPPEGRRVLEGHPAAGHALALGAGVPASASEWILHCGERFDRAGGAAGPPGGEIPLESRIIAAACEYDALLREQPTDTGAGPRWALITLTEAAGSKLDPLVVDALARVVERAAASVEAQ